MTQLVRAIGLGRATAMVIGTIIGASIFVQPSLVSAAVPSVVGVLLVWTASGALTLIGALITAELASAYPRTGGVYVFLREAYGAPVAYLWGWAMFWSMHTGIIAAIATVFARYLGQFVMLDEAGTRAAAAGAIIVLSAVNWIGVRWGSGLQAAFTATKLAAVFAIVALGVWFAVGHAGGPASGVSLPTTAGGFVIAMAAGLFAYGGWHMVTYAADETRDPTHTIPRALVIGTLTVTVVYIAVNASYLVALPLATVATSQRIAADFAAAVVGRNTGDVVAVLVMLSALGAMTGIILAGPRVYLAMAADGLLFRWAGRVHPVRRTPHVAIAMQGTCACLLVATGTYRALVTRVVFTEWLFFAMMAASLYFLPSRPGYAPAYRMPARRVLAGVFVASSLAIVLHQIATQPRDALLGLGLVALGLPVYWIWKNSVTGRGS